MYDAFIDILQYDTFDDFPILLSDVHFVHPVALVIIVFAFNSLSSASNRGETTILNYGTFFCWWCNNCWSAGPSTSGCRSLTHPHTYIVSIPQKKLLLALQFSSDIFLLELFVFVKNWNRMWHTHAHTIWSAIVEKWRASNEFHWCGCCCRFPILYQCVNVICIRGRKCDERCDSHLFAIEYQ